MILCGLLRIIDAADVALGTHGLGTHEQVKTMKIYQQSGSYIPRSDSQFRDFAANFSNLISADPGRYGLSKADADVIRNAATRYIDYFTLVQSPATRTSALVGQKDAVRASAEASFRIYARLIRANMGVDNQDRIELGLHVPDPTRTPISAPSTAPILNIVDAYNGRHTLRFRDETTPNSYRKPPGVIAMQLAMAVGEQFTVDPREAALIGTYSRQPITVVHDPSDSCRTASYFGRWITKRGLIGPWSLGVWHVIGFGGSVSEPVKSTGPVAAGGLKIAA